MSTRSTFQWRKINNKDKNPIYILLCVTAYFSWSARSSNWRVWMTVWLWAAPLNAHYGSVESARVRQQNTVTIYVTKPPASQLLQRADPSALWHARYLLKGMLCITLGFDPESWAARPLFWITAALRRSRHQLSNVCDLLQPRDGGLQPEAD